MSSKGNLRSTRRSVDQALSQLATLAEIARDEPLLSHQVPAISAWSIGEQIEHLRRSDLSILDAIDGLDTNRSAEGSMKIVGRLVLATGFIPRGRARAPSAVVPLKVEPRVLPEQLEAVGERFTALIEDLERISGSRATIRHPALGHFTASQMLAFAGIHHHHHLKIIKDIRRNSKK